VLDHICTGVHWEEHEMRPMAKSTSVSTRCVARDLAISDREIRLIRLIRPKVLKRWVSAVDLHVTVLVSLRFEELEG
jgi:hypothetical protein